jgi:molecular chaperone DnaK
MTRYPLIREAVGEHFKKAPNTSVNPDEVVAVGAAIQAWNLTNEEEGGGSVLLDVTPQSLGVRTVGGFCETLIPRNTAVPTESTKVFHTAFDNQTEVRISVYQGESRMADDNELLGEFVLEGLALKPRGQVKVRVSFEIDNDGIVHVRAVDSVLGMERAIRIESRSGVAVDASQVHRFDDIDF